MNRKCVYVLAGISYVILTLFCLLVGAAVSAMEMAERNQMQLSPPDPSLKDVPSVY